MDAGGVNTLTTHTCLDGALHPRAWPFAYKLVFISGPVLDNSLLSNEFSALSDGLSRFQSQVKGNCQQDCQSIQSLT
jgi:hypothetical protein